MKAALPLVRSVSQAVTPTSRIPHLEYHILRRSRPKLVSRRQCTRHSSSTVDLGPYPQSLFDAPAETTATPAVENDRRSDSFPPNRARAQASVDFAADQIVQRTASQSAGFVNLGDIAQDTSGHQLLEEGCPERLLAWLTAHPAGRAFVNTASNVDFERAFLALDPVVLVEPFKHIQKHFNGAKLNDYQFRYNRSLVERLRAFTRSIDQILVDRQNSGIPLTLSACRHALRCAGAAGDARVADDIFNNLMSVNSIVPDLKCYNSLMHAHIWNLAYTEHARRSFRIFPRNAKLRSQLWRPKNLLGYRVSEKLPDPPWTLRSSVLNSFRRISENAWNTDEETFSNLIIGLARTGDLSGVESILKSVWNIDVDALNNFDEEEIQSPTYYDEDHPLRPTHNLLFAIVHAYCVNSDTTKAWSILDYTSRNYALDIPEYVWEEILEWTFVLSKARQSKSRAHGQAQGQTRAEEVENLYNRLLDEPYNLQPTFSMLKLLAKSYRQQRRLLNKSLDTFRRLDSQLHRDLDQLRQMVDICKSTIIPQSRKVDNGLLPEDHIQFCRNFQLTFLSTVAQHGFLLREIDHILTGVNWPGDGKQQEWQRQSLPKIVEEFECYLPRLFRYKTRTGSVAFHSPKELRKNDPTRYLLAEAAVIYQAIIPYDLLEVEKNLDELAHDYESALASQLETGLDSDDSERSFRDTNLQILDKLDHWDSHQAIGKRKQAILQTSRASVRQARSRSSGPRSRSH